MAWTDKRETVNGANRAIGPKPVAIKNERRFGARSEYFVHHDPSTNPGQDHTAFYPRSRSGHAIVVRAEKCLCIPLA